MRYIMSQHMHMQFARSTIKAPPDNLLQYSIVFLNGDCYCQK